MNLDMPQKILDAIARKGSKAGTMLATQFDFSNHWWIRWRNVASAVERFTIDFSHAADAPPTVSYEDPRRTAFTGSPAAPSYRFTGEQQRDAQKRLQKMIDEGLLWNDTDPDLTRGAPRPLPHLRIVPTF